ncbi:MAG: hypothetical protein L3K26_05210 [Candidatus Hydrogenedentes bacterium]|nr:hypothetical protein [Candidatus Hydrogenedentota bacterium]
MKNILDSISGAEALQILKTLCATDADLRRRIEAKVEKVLQSIAPEDVAAEVVFDLECIDVEDLWNRSGRTEYGYSTPEEMAVEMVEEVLQPYEHKIQKYEKTGLSDSSKKYCMGVLKGIYQFEHESETEFKDWATDIPGECFAGILEAWKKGACERDIMEMDTYLSCECHRQAE